MIVKSFTDDLAWDVQRKLVNTYFKYKDTVQAIEPTKNGLILPEDKFINALDTLTACSAVFQNMLNFVTINYKQQQELLQVARKHINCLLGGAHSQEYKDNARTYFKNMWQDFCLMFGCASYKDLNPLYIESAKNFIQKWKYNK
jgi:hypothetical protein